MCTEVTVLDKFLSQEQVFLESIRGWEVYQIWVTGPQVLLPVKVAGAESIFRRDNILPLECKPLGRMETAINSQRKHSTIQRLKMDLKVPPVQHRGNCLRSEITKVKTKFSLHLKPKVSFSLYRAVLNAYLS